MIESIKVIGELRVRHIRAGKVLSDTGFMDNIVTTAGKTEIARIIEAGTGTLVSHMGFGTGSTAVAASDTALTTELTGNGYTRKATTKSISAAGTVQYIATLTGVTNNPTIQEAGLFNAATAGILVAHQLTGAVNLATAADSLEVTWKLTFA